MTYQEVLEQARTCMGKCHACPVCSGLTCKNMVPGPGAKGLGTGAIRNYQKWQELCVNMDTICENAEVDTSYDFFGHKLTIPVMAGPVGAVAMHYSDKYDDLSYNNVLVAGCAKAGIAVKRLCSHSQWLMGLRKKLQHAIHLSSSTVSDIRQSTNRVNSLAAMQTNC